MNHVTSTTAPYAGQRLSSDDVLRIMAESRANLLRFADLRFADLRSANLRSADLSFADLSSTSCLSVTGLPSGHAILAPLPTGWRLTVGCWSGTITELRELITRDEGWPEAEGDQIIARRPMLAALADMCDAWVVDNTDILGRVQETWTPEGERILGRVQETWTPEGTRREPNTEN